MYNDTINKSKITTGRFYLLDLARAVAAICVVLQHYQHFYYVSPQVYVDNFSRDQQPFYNLIKPFYMFGNVAVQFFFVLSGFIFFFMYRELISEKKINFTNFIILRISRLYPLHLLSLMMVMILQIIYMDFNNLYFAYSSNTLKNFILHFFLIHEWGYGISWSFNAASWSISVEFLLYITFFYIALNSIKNLSQSIFFLMLICLFFILTQSKLGLMPEGFVCFYIGGVTYFLYQKLKEIMISSKNKKILIVIALIIINFFVMGRFFNSIFYEWQEQLNFLTGNRIMLLLFFIKFPLIIISLSLLQIIFTDLGKSFQFLGDISYTLYLIHFPVEIVFSLFDTQISPLNFSSNYVFLTYFLVIFLSSLIVYKFFEIPLKKIIRKKLIKKPI